ncbi:hypothetical protein H1R20_g1510, partial [Candolleomyces eurysporus]
MIPCIIAIAVPGPTLTVFILHLHLPHALSLPRILARIAIGNSLAPTGSATSLIIFLSPAIVFIPSNPAIVFIPLSPADIVFIPASPATLRYIPSRTATLGCNPSRIATFPLTPPRSAIIVTSSSSLAGVAFSPSISDIHLTPRFILLSINPPRPPLLTFTPSRPIILPSIPSTLTSLTLIGDVHVFKTTL